jgi:hypothetical protein
MRQLLTKTIGFLFFSNRNQESVDNLRVFTFMLTSGDVGKSVVVKEADPQIAEQKLRQKYIGWNVRFLWEW